jgi:hypothetical protein
MPYGYRIRRQSRCCFTRSNSDFHILQGYQGRSPCLVGPIAPLTRHLDCFLAESVHCRAGTSGWFRGGCPFALDGGCAITGGL